ncbi:MAG: methylmalonyl Co-A mutase-associated GTPase MeaB [Acidobacteriota bacterium]
MTSADHILQGDRRALARAATEIENGEAAFLLHELSIHPGHALIIGLTGPPGAGKSTLCDQLIRTLRAENKTVAVIAIDPSSPFTGGALLGDRIRMQQHHADPGVFIRSMAARGFPGGLARATRDVVTLFDAAGFDVVIIETVGVGQSEIEIARLAHVTVVVLVPGAGDDVQSIKAGIMEIAQVFAINKADLPGADTLANHLHTATADDPTPPEIVKVVALEGKGIDDLLAAIRRSPARPFASLSEKVADE